MAQGVTEPKRTQGSNAARDFLRNNAAPIRSDLGAVTEFGFHLDDGIDLHADPGLGSDYADSTIAYKLFETGHVPDDDTLETEHQRHSRCLRAAGGYHTEW